jgi:hypothetical protein
MCLTDEKQGSACPPGAWRQAVYASHGRLVSGGLSKNLTFANPHAAKSTQAFDVDVKN